VVAREEDIEGLLFPEQRERLKLRLPPEVDKRDRSGDMAFSTVFLSRGAQDGIFRVNFNDWAVDWDAETGLSWSARPLAHGLLSPRYMP